MLVREQRVFSASSRIGPFKGLELRRYGPVHGQKTSDAAFWRHKTFNDALRDKRPAMRGRATDRDDRADDLRHRARVSVGRFGNSRGIEDGSRPKTW